MDFSTKALDMVQSGLTSGQTISSEQVLYNRIKDSGDKREQLKKAGEEFEAIFVSKMLTEMDKTVDRSNSIFGEKNQYVDTFKSIIYQQIGHDLASNPRTTIGLAEQIYKQSEKYIGN